MRTVGEETAPLISTSGTLSDPLLAGAGVPVVDVPLVSVGGGMGSFALVDTLRIADVAEDSIRVLGRTSSPWENYCHLIAASQMRAEERIRSDSASAPDCIWGFPGYALREAFRARRAIDAVKPLSRVLAEPVLTHFYTPRISQVVAGVRREATRIGYEKMLVQGEVRAVRRREEGGYFTLIEPVGAAPGELVAVQSRFVHLAVGYPGLRWLPEARHYRRQTRSSPRMVHAYEPHDHVYADLARHPGTVIVRGGGIAASRILQRVLDDREQGGAPTNIVHVLRHRVAGAHGPHRFLRRSGEQGWAYQGFNWPKAAWGGQYQRRIAKAGPEERAWLYQVLGGTTTALRRPWRKQLERARRSGAYRLIEGEVTRAEVQDSGLDLTLTTTSGIERIAAKYVIDATGMEGDVRGHPLLADVLNHTGARRNDAARLAVSDSFEVIGTRSGIGRMYASGPSTLGNGYAPVDTLLGMQYAALRIADDLAVQGFGTRIGSSRSVSQWWRWLRGVSP
jgi:hypothetical protein